MVEHGIKANSTAQADGERDELIADLRTAFEIDPAQLPAFLAQAARSALPRLAIAMARMADRSALGVSERSATDPTGSSDQARDDGRAPAPLTERNLEDLK